MQYEDWERVVRFVGYVAIIIAHATTIAKNTKSLFPHKKKAKRKKRKKTNNK